ncbi:hypothetical protein [Nonomuraea diastatica]|uniref:Secreted protein n=1 Tax=Nonomuraea diastatica TaxID=1848329 RepID=A0A4R4WHS9_9ACTN|nr:hypothetical protein [Nonomuraea diastatica]TDD16967.1 hypothetical protein E1294_29510 [Nonomuraea diastatica]
MYGSARLLAVTGLVAAGLLSAASAANAVVDPAAIADCLTSSIGELTTVIDPSAPGVPAEIPAVHCLTGP